MSEKLAIVLLTLVWAWPFSPVTDHGQRQGGFRSFAANNMKSGKPEKRDREEIRHHLGD